jgi:hypothetical protein
LFGYPGGVCLYQNDLAGKVLQFQMGPLDRIFIDIDANENSFRAQSLTEQKTMTSLSYGRIDHYRIRRQVYLFG